MNRPPPPDGLARGLSDTALLALGSLVAAVFGFVSLRLLLTGLGEADYARYCLFQAAAGLALVGLTWPAPAVLRLGAEEVAARGTVGRTVASVGALILASLLALAVLTALGQGPLERWLGWRGAPYVLGLAGATAALGLLSEALKPLGRVGLRTLIPALTRVLFALLLALPVLREESLSLSQAALLCCVTVLPALALSGGVLLGRLGELRPDAALAARAARFGWPMLLRNLGVAGLLYVDMLVLRALRPLEDVGRYEVAYRVAEQVVVLGFVLEHLAGPILARSAATGGGARSGARYLRHALPPLAWGWGLGVALLVPLAPLLLTALGAHSPAASAEVLQVVLLAVALRGVTSLENPLLEAHLLSLAPTAFFFLALLVNAAGDLLSLRWGAGLTGPAWATVLAFATQAALRALYLRRRFGVSTWRGWLAAAPALALVLLDRLGAGVGPGLLAWGLLVGLCVAAARSLGALDPEARRALERVRLPGPLRALLAWLSPPPGALTLRLPARGAAPARVVPLPTPDPDRRRVLLLVTELHPAGAERVVADLARGLDPARWQVVVACLRSPGGDDGAVAAELTAAGVAVTPLRLGGKLDPAGAWRLLRLLRAFRPHVLHAHLFHANLAARLLGRLGGAEVVVSTLHVVERRQLPARRLLERLTAGRDDATVCVSEAVATWARTALGARPARTRVIPNGIDLARFQRLPGREEARARLALPDDGPWIGSVARLDPQKDPRALLEAFARLAPRLPARLLLAGRGPEEPALRARAAALGLSERVHFLGQVEDVPALLAALDVFCLPSRWEGFGLAALEALAAGVPAVVSEVDSLPEVVGSAARLVPPDDPARLSEALLELLSDPAARAALAAAGPARAARFSGAAMLAGYQALYADLLGDPSSPGSGKIGG